MWIGFIIPLTLLARDYKAKNVSIGICTQVICFQHIFYWIFANYQRWLNLRRYVQFGQIFPKIIDYPQLFTKYKVQNFYSDLVHFFEEDGTNLKIPSKIKPPLLK